MNKILTATLHAASWYPRQWQIVARIHNGYNDHYTGQQALTAYATVLATFVALFAVTAPHRAAYEQAKTDLATSIKLGTAGDLICNRTADNRLGVPIPANQISSEGNSFNRLLAAMAKQSLCQKDDRNTADKAASSVERDLECHIGAETIFLSKESLANATPSQRQLVQNLATATPRRCWPFPKTP